ncbi:MULTISPECIES: PLP-dependent aminotransferase family protein [Derxia]|uniref:PLP-dependent aminotransferase family protein n=1 Tax=Derxia gummosa DSM 723 TaxID=1121388 RepID=A0A8B6X5X8_9BURK|nr:MULTISPECIES: PLP-dependent aminotransferase family protein [Derxia]
MPQAPLAPAAGDGPIHLRLCRRIREAIAAGQLAPGARLPSVRSLASELHLSRGTVELAYQVLATEGFVAARGPAGSFVAPGVAGWARANRGAARAPGAIAAPGVTATGTALDPTPPDAPAPASPLPIAPAPASPRLIPSVEPRIESATLLPFQLGLPALDAFPRKTWARIAGRQARALDVAAMGHPDPAGHAPLRRAIAIHAGIARGIACAPEQVFVTAGYRAALDLVCRALLRPGEGGWFEDPGYPFARRHLELAGLKLAPVPVDAEGLDVAAGEALAPRARFAVVTPAHQSPTGVALSLPRRLALLAWASRAGAWIIEDDYDSEFRYHGRPLPALTSLDRDGRVLFAGSFSKLLFPGLRLAYLVVPAAEVGRFAAAAQTLHGPGPVATQASVADFMAQGHFARHLRRMRALYAERRGWLAEALAEAEAVVPADEPASAGPAVPTDTPAPTGGPGWRVAPQAGGLHLLARLAAGRDDRRIAAEARARGLAVQALGDWRVGTGDTDDGSGAEDGGLLLGFANFTSAEEARKSVARLAEVAGLR